jgi:hypothetical protein
MRFDPPGLLFVAIAIAAALIYREYYERLARVDGRIESDANISGRILASPLRVFPIAIRQATARLLSLLRRHKDPEIERLRLMVILLFGLDLFVLAWIVWG